jgi:hypothetical protein
MGPQEPWRSSPAPERRGHGSLWVVGILGALGLLLSTVAGGILAAQGIGYVVSTLGDDSVVRLDDGVGSAQVEPRRTYALLVPDGSGMRCSVWAPDGTLVSMRATGSTVTVETPSGRWSGTTSFTAPQPGSVLLGCEPATPGDAVRLVTAPDWDLGLVVLLVVLAGLGGLMVLGAGVGLVVVLVNRSSSRPSPPPPDPYGHPPRPPSVR